VNGSGAQKTLRAMGRRVWGMAGADEIETNRWRLGEVLVEHDLARPEQELVKGTEALEKVLKETKDKFLPAVILDDGTIRVDHDHAKGSHSEAFIVANERCVEAEEEVEKILKDFGKNCSQVYCQIVNCSFTALL
jgi:hypothetical protein